MLAAVFSAPEECEMLERDLLSPADGHVIVRVEACGVCGTDAHIYRGRFPAKFPLIAGHEIAGIVDEAGPSVTSLRPGDRVSIDPNMHCGVCRPCRRGFTHLCRHLSSIGVTRDGGFAARCLVPARQCLPLPGSISFEAGALAEPIACCVHGIDLARIRGGEVVVIIGAGAIGLIMLQLARLQGAAQIIVSEPNAEKRTVALRLGATRVVDPFAESLEEIGASATEGDGPDVVIECVGSRTTAQQALDLAGIGARVVFFGVADQGTRISLSPYHIYRRELHLVGSFTNPFTQARAIALLASKRLDTGDLISHRLPLSDLPQAVDLLESGAASKIIIQPQSAP